MSVTIYLSGHLKNFTGGSTEVSLDTDFHSVADALQSLWRLHPALRDRILNEQGEIRQHVNIFLGSEDVKRLDGLRTAVDRNEIHIFNAVSGG
jgi:molybdopterin synthase sulfur carrier subunit